MPITPPSSERRKEDGMTVLIESSAGALAGYSDEDYVSPAAQIRSRFELFGSTEMIVQVRLLGANPEVGVITTAAGPGRKAPILLIVLIAVTTRMRVSEIFVWLGRT